MTDPSFSIDDFTSPRDHERIDFDNALMLSATAFAVTQSRPPGADQAKAVAATRKCMDNLGLTPKLIDAPADPFAIQILGE